ncbi:MAG: DNA double-strand break repair nuclease NurA [Candidatus Baldrarchaeia archaeon]
MFDLQRQLKNVVKNLVEIERSKETFCSILRSVKTKIEFSFLPQIGRLDLLENKFAYSVTPTNLKGLCVAGVDGGVVSRSLHCADIIITRAVAAIFRFESENGPYVEYFPDKFPEPIIIVNITPLSRINSEINANLERLKAELEVAIKVQDEYTIDAILLNGSILPQITDKPFTSNVLLTRKYDEILDLYLKLYEKSMETDTILAGVIEDSRSTRFMQIINRMLPHLIYRYPELKDLLNFDYRRVLRLMRDSDFLFRFLDVGERTLAFHYSESPYEHPILRDLKEKGWEPPITVFYLKTVEFDVPIRIEYLTSRFDPVTLANRLASIIYPLSSYHPEYATPSVIIEADARARLLESDLEIIYDSLVHAMGLTPSLLKLRRDRRPF